MNVRLLVFARAPVAGAAKSRLIPALGEAGAAALHAALVRDTLVRATAAGIGPVELWTTGDDPQAFLPGLAREHGVEHRRQQGADLGERMGAALASENSSPHARILIGTDCPRLAVADLRTAASRLASNDAVLGPADDGGYVLIGLNRMEPGLFRGIEWGTDTVLAATRQRLAAAGWQWSELERRPDVDRPEDLPAVAALGDGWARLCRCRAGQEPAAAAIR